MGLDNIVNVTISRETRTVTRAGFGVPLLFSVHSKFAERIKFYTSMVGVADDFSSVDPEYVAANDIFSQPNPPERIAIGRATAASAYADDIDDIIDASDDWYALVPLDKAKANIIALAAKIEGLKKIMFAVTADADVKNGVAGNVAKTLEAATYDRTLLLYSEETDNWANAALAGKCLSEDPGSITFKFKTLNGITADTLTETQITNISGDKCNYYTLVGGVNIIQEGVVASGEYADVIRDIDWLEARIKEDVFEMLANAKKVPYTDAGVAQVENVLRGRLQNAVTVGVLSTFSISTPKVSTISSADKLARTLPDVTFDGTLSGAIHKVEINGAVTV